MSKNLATADHLNSLASAVKDKINVLGSTPSTINGGLWLEDDGNSPIIKLNCGGAVFKLTPELVQNADPQLTFSSSNVTLNSGETGTVIYANADKEETNTIEVSYLGNGSISISSDCDATYSTANGKRYITIPPHDFPISSTIYVNLSAAGYYASSQKSIVVVFIVVVKPPVIVPVIEPEVPM